MLSMDLKGKTALIGGSTQGIGFASAKALAALGASCVLVARNEDKLKHAITMLDARPGQHHEYLVADYADPEQVRNAVGAYVKDNTVHILVNNSGGPAGGPRPGAKSGCGQWQASSLFAHQSLATAS